MGMVLVKWVWLMGAVYVLELIKKVGGCGGIDCLQFIANVKIESGSL